MRRLTMMGSVALLALGLATGASALSVDPDPMLLSGHGSAGSVSVDITGTTLTFELEVTQGKVSRATVMLVDNGGVAREIVDKGHIDTPEGVNIKRVRVNSDGSVEFSFKSSFFHQHIHSGEKSDPFYVSYDQVLPGDVLTVTGFRYSVFGSFGAAQATVVPEPSAAALVGLGVVGLALAGRRRV